jgi:hypothetical protein
VDFLVVLDREFKTIVEENLSKRTRAVVSNPELMSSLTAIELKRIRQEVHHNIAGRIFF